MRVAQVFDVFGEVAEEEDVGFADFAGYFDLEIVNKLLVIRVEEAVGDARVLG